MSYRKATPEHYQFLIKFKHEYFSYCGPWRREKFLEQVLTENHIPITVRHARRILTGK